MADNEFLNEGDQGSTEESGTALRKFATEQKKRAEAAEAKLQELAAKLAKHDADAIFTKLKIPGDYRELYHGDLTEEAITAWATKWGKLFGVGGEEQTPEQEEQRKEEERFVAAGRTGGTSSKVSTAELDSKIKEFKSGSRGKTNADLQDFMAQVLNIPSRPYIAGG